MANFVFVLGTYYPESDANVTCGKNVIDILKLRGHSVTCVCGTSLETKNEDYEGITVNRIFHDRYDIKLRNTKNITKQRLLKMKHFISSIIKIPSYPVTEIGFANRLYRKIEEINMNEKIDCIVGISRPFETIYAITAFKEKHKDCQAIAVFLDILKEANAPFNMPKSIYSIICDSREKKYLKKIDHALVPKSSHKIYNTDFFYQEHEKFHYIDFPVLKINSFVSNSYETITDGLMVYAGSTNKNYRNPIFMVEVLIEVCFINGNYSFEMYGASELREELISLSDRCSNVFSYKGVVTKQEADRANQRGEILISIGNADSLLLPSKIFELFATRKPIIHFAKNKEDLALKYMEQYENACIVVETDGKANAIKTINEFLYKEHALISEMEILETFGEATPEHVTDILLECLEGI